MSIMKPKIDECELGHRFAKLPNHPTKEGRAQCPNCLAIGLKRCRKKHKALKEEIENKIKILKKQENHSNIYNYDKDCINAIISYLEGVLSHIPKSKDAKDD